MADGLRRLRHQLRSVFRSDNPGVSGAWRRARLRARAWRRRIRRRLAPGRTEAHQAAHHRRLSRWRRIPDRTQIHFSSTPGRRGNQRRRNPHRPRHYRTLRALSLRAETQASGPANIPEFGTTTEPDGFKALFAMDAYQHVRANTPYPAVLLTTGVNDPRVAPWEAAKMTARLQAATSSGKPI